MGETESYVMMGIKKGEAEVRDLERLWKYLSCEERDESIQYALTFTHLDPESPVEMSDEASKRCKAVEDKVKELYARNLQDRLSDQGQEYDDASKLNLNASMYKITALSDDDLVELGKTLGIEDVEKMRGNRYRLLALFMMMGRGSTRAMFFAFRNIIGKRVG